MCVRMLFLFFVYSDEYLMESSYIDTTDYRIEYYSLRLDTKTSQIHFRKTPWLIDTRFASYL